MKWLQDNPVGMALVAAMSGVLFLALLAVGMAIILEFTGVGDKLLKRKSSTVEMR